MKASELGFFYPDVPQDWGTGDSFEKDGKHYYKDVNTFLGRIDSAVVIHSWEAVRAEIDGSFMGEALLWWNSIIPALRRGWLLAPDQNDLTAEINKRFKLAPCAALDKLNNTRYTTFDCQNQRGVTEYVSRIQAAVNGIGFSGEYMVVLYAWKNLEPELRYDIPEPKESATVQDFMDELRRYQSNWWDKYRKASAYSWQCCAANPASFSTSSQSLSASSKLQIRAAIR